MEMSVSKDQQPETATNSIADGDERVVRLHRVNPEGSG